MRCARAATRATSRGRCGSTIWLAFLRERYGLHIDQLPPGEGFGAPTIDERKALRSNVQSFTGRLREIGFYRDLSDAYVTQTVVPRYTIEEKTEGART